MDGNTTHVFGGINIGNEIAARSSSVFVTGAVRLIQSATPLMVAAVASKAFEHISVPEDILQAPQKAINFLRGTARARSLGVMVWRAVRLLHALPRAT